MDMHVRDALITDYEPLIETLMLPDINDRHILAAAIIGHCDVILTQNLSDFPPEILKPYGIEALHPDDFLLGHLTREAGRFCDTVRKVRARLKNPPYSADDYLLTLVRQGLVTTVAQLEQFKEAL